MKHVNPAIGAGSGNGSKLTLCETGSRWTMRRYAAVTAFEFRTGWRQPGTPNGIVDLPNHAQSGSGIRAQFRIRAYQVQVLLQRLRYQNAVKGIGMQSRHLRQLSQPAHVIRTQ